MNQKTKEYRENLANAFLSVLEEKELDWKKEWQGKANGFGRQENAKSGHRYRGLNSFYLTMVAADRGYEDPRWATFKQVQEKGWRLKDAKGQGVKVEYWFPFDTKEKKSISWEDFKKQSLTFDERYILRANYSTVFNASLIEGIPKLPEPEIHPQVAADELISRISRNMEVEIMNDGGDRAYYNIQKDKIHLPRPEYFFTDYAYNSTALHELSHATGARHRLNRIIDGERNGPEYAYEELVAEISSCFMSANLPIAQDESHIENHKAYVQSWVQVIKKEPETLVKAIRQAEKAAGYLEYKAELLTEKEFQQINGSSMEISAEYVTEREETKEQVKMYARPEPDRHQMAEIRDGFEDGLDLKQVEQYAKPELEGWQMAEARENLEGRIKAQSRNAWKRQRPISREEHNQTFQDKPDN